MILNHLKHFMPTKKARLNIIIHAAAAEAGAVGLATAQVPGDRFIIGGIQIWMIIEIAAEFGHSISKSAAQSLFYTVIASVIGPEIANQLIKYIPVIGNISNMTVAASITETIGWATVSYYENLEKKG